MTLKELLKDEAGLEEKEIKSLSVKDLKELKNAVWMYKRGKSQKQKAAGVMIINSLLYRVLNKGQAIPLETKYDTRDFTKAAA